MSDAQFVGVALYNAFILSNKACSEDAMLNTPCPHCNASTMPPPPKRGNRVYVPCPSCQKKSLATFTDQADGNVLVKYVATTNHVVGNDLTVYLTVRVTPAMLLWARKAGSAKVREILESGLL